MSTYSSIQKRQIRYTEVVSRSHNMSNNGPLLRKCFRSFLCDLRSPVVAGGFQAYRLAMFSTKWQKVKVCSIPQAFNIGLLVNNTKYSISINTNLWIYLRILYNKHNFLKFILRIPKHKQPTTTVNTVQSPTRKCSSPKLCLDCVLFYA